MAERQVSDPLSAVRVPLIVSEEELSESTRETRTRVQHGNKDSTSRNRRASTEATDKNTYSPDSSTLLRSRGLKWRGRYFAQDESGTFIMPPEPSLSEETSVGKNLLGVAFY